MPASQGKGTTDDDAVRSDGQWAHSPITIEMVMGSSWEYQQSPYPVPLTNSTIQSSSPLQALCQHQGTRAQKNLNLKERKFGHSYGSAEK